MKLKINGLNSALKKEREIRRSGHYCHLMCEFISKYEVDVFIDGEFPDSRSYVQYASEDVKYLGGLLFSDRHTAKDCRRALEMMSDRLNEDLSNVNAAYAYVYSKNGGYML